MLLMSEIISSVQEKETSYQKNDNVSVLYRIYARRARLFGIWVAEKMFIFGEKAFHYANEMVVYEHNYKVDGSIIEKAFQDITAHNIDISLEEIQKQYYTLFLKSEEAILIEADIYAS